MRFFLILKSYFVVKKFEMNENADFSTSLKRDAHFEGSEALKKRDFRDKEGVKNEPAKKKDSGKHFG